MDKLTEFVTNSFVDREVSALMSKCIAKSEPVSPSSSISDVDDHPHHRVPSPQRITHSKKPKKELIESHHHNNNNNNNNNEEEPRRKIASEKGKQS